MNKLFIKEINYTIALAFSQIVMSVLSIGQILQILDLDLLMV